MREIAIAPDGTGLYGLSTFDDAVAAFARDPATGTLTFASCIGAESDLGKEFGVPDPCAKVPPRTRSATARAWPARAAWRSAPTAATSSSPPAATRRSTASD
jgi:hypothetical protein